MSKEKPSAQENLFGSLAGILVPEEFLKDFEVTSVEERPAEWVITLREKEDRVPKELTDKRAVLDGYCNPVSILTHAFSLKKIYLQMYRRRWKEPGGDVHYSNTYDLHLPGMRTSKEFGAFLKEIGG